jgi:hypothetical protein
MQVNAVCPFPLVAKDDWTDAIGQGACGVGCRPLMFDFDEYLSAATLAAVFGFFTLVLGGFLLLTWYFFGESQYVELGAAPDERRYPVYFLACLCALAFFVLIGALKAGPVVSGVSYCFSGTEVVCTLLARARERPCMRCGHACGRWSVRAPRYPHQDSCKHSCTRSWVAVLFFLSSGMPLWLGFSALRRDLMSALSLLPFPSFLSSFLHSFVFPVSPFLPSCTHACLLVCLCVCLPLCLSGRDVLVHGAGALHRLLGARRRLLVARLGTQNGGLARSPERLDGLIAGWLLLPTRRRLCCACRALCGTQSSLRLRPVCPSRHRPFPLLRR